MWNDKSFTQSRTQKHFSSWGLSWLKAWSSVAQFLTNMQFVILQCISSVLNHSKLEDEASTESRMRSGVQTMEKEVDILKGEGGQHPTAAWLVDAVHELISFASLSLTGLIISVRVPRAIVFKKKSHLSLWFHAWSWGGEWVQAQGQCNAVPGRLSTERSHVHGFLAVVGLYWLLLLLDKPRVLVIALCHVHSPAPWLVGLFCSNSRSLFCFFYISLPRPFPTPPAVAPVWATEFTVCQCSYSDCVVRVSLMQKNLLVLVWLEKCCLTVGRGTRAIRSSALVNFFKAANWLFDERTYEEAEIPGTPLEGGGNLYR